MSAYTTAVLADSPSSYWRLGEASGTSIIDQQGAVTGTYHTPVTLAQPGLLASDTDTCVQFTNGFGDMGLHYGFAAKANFSVECWAENTISSSDAVNRHFISAESASLTGWFLTWTASTASISYGRTGTSLFVLGASPVNTKQHVVMTYDGTNVCLYINGVLAGGPSASSGTIATQTVNLRLGCQSFNTNNAFQGYLDEVAIYPTALSATQVLAHFNAGSGVVRNGSASLASALGLSATAAMGRGATAHLASTLSLSATPSVSRGAGATLASVLALSATGRVVRGGGATLALALALTARGQVDRSTSADLTFVLALTARAAVERPNVSVTHVTSTIAAMARVTTAATPTMAVSSPIAATAQVTSTSIPG